MSESIETLVIECVRRHAGNKELEITSETALLDLEVESLDFVEIVFDLEEALDIDIEYNANDVESILTVKDLCAKVTAMSEKQKAG